MSATPGLFDDAPVASATELSLIRRSISFGQSKKAKSVNRLLAQVDSLRAQYEREKRRLDDALIFQAGHIRPKQERVTALRTEVVRALARFLDDRRLGKADKRILCAILMEQIDEVLAHAAPPDPDIAQLFERLHGIGFDEAVQSDLDNVRGEMAGFFEELGLDMDVPDLRPDMTEEEVAASAAQMADRMRQLYEAQVESAPGRRKTKRELREEKRAERYEQLRKISIGAIYKRLVKALHPDLEPDPSQRERKVGLMQQVTAAHAGNDLSTLLRLEIECIDGAGVEAAHRTDEALNAYAEVFRQQIAQLRLGIIDLPLHPRYQPLLIDDDPLGVPRVIDGPAEVRRHRGRTVFREVL